jgi:hypothetical protein
MEVQWWVGTCEKKTSPNPHHSVIAPSMYLHVPSTVCTSVDAVHVSEKLVQCTVL